MEFDLCAGFAGFAGLLELIGRLPFFVALLRNGAIALNFEFEKVGKSVDDRDTDAVETAGNFVGVAVEFSACVENGKHNFGGGALFRGMHVNGNAAAVVEHGDGIVGVNRDVDFFGVTGHRFIYGVVNNFPDPAMKTHFAGPADLHSAAPTNS